LKLDKYISYKKSLPSPKEIEKIDKALEKTEGE